MLTVNKENVEVLKGGIIKLHTHDIPIHTRIIVSAIIETKPQKNKQLADIPGKGRGLFSKPSEVDEFLRTERHNWEN